jgi:aryl-alcohol dehydrogenase-like predicted oxidoreductase
MEYRPLGRTGLIVSELGYGAWGIGGAGWVGAREDESLPALHRAIELGVTFIDTARGYGDSERIVGQVVREHPGETVLVATKVPPKNGTFPAPTGIDPMEVFPGSGSERTCTPACVSPAWTPSTSCSCTCGAMRGLGAVIGWRRSTG